MQQKTQSTQTPIRGDKKVIFGWVVYDWANSAYITTIAVAILPMYFAGVIVPAEGFRIGSTVFAAETLWGFMVSAAAFIVFFMAPVLGAIADYYNAKKLLFEQMADEGKDGVAVINIDDSYGEKLAEEFADRQCPSST